jgi:pilus assembly protein CpaB
VGGTLAVVLALIGALLVFTYAQGANQRAMQELEPREVLVVQQEVPAGTTVEALAEFVAVEPQPSGAVPVSALSSLEGTEGKVTAVALVAGEQLVEERLIDPAELQTQGSVEVPKGLQEVTFLLEPQRIVGGKVTAGDTIGLFVSFEGGDSGTDETEEPDGAEGAESGAEGADGAESGEALTQQVLHKTLVTGLQRAEATTEPADSAEPTGKPNPEALPAGSMMVTVAVNDVDAAKIIYATEFGRLWLTKEPAEATESVPTPITRAEVFP